MPKSTRTIAREHRQQNLLAIINAALVIILADFKYQEHIPAFELKNIADKLKLYAEKLKDEQKVKDSLLIK